MRHHWSAACSLFLAAGLAAQSTAVLPVPLGLGAEGNQATTSLWAATSPTGARVQAFYPRGTLPQGRLTITRLRWRHDGGAAASAGGTWGNVQVRMATAALPLTAVDPTFANNLGTDQANVFAGGVAVAPTTAVHPGAHYVDLPLATPFVFAGTGDLVIDVTLGGGTWSGGGAAATDCHVLANGGGLCLHSADAAAATGTLAADLGLVVQLTYTVDPASAETGVFGSGSYDTMCYQQFIPAKQFNLSNSTIRFSPTAGSYTVSRRAPTFRTATSAPLPAGDDVLVVLSLPWNFNHPGGSTNTITACSNGFLWLDGAQTGTDAVPSSPALTTQAARLAVAWSDWNIGSNAQAGANGTWHYDVEPSGSAVYVTWSNVGHRGWNAQFGGPSTNTFQCALFRDGSIEYRYRSVPAPFANHNLMVGIKPAAGTFADPGSTNLRIDLPMRMMTGSVAALRLQPLANRPILGTTVPLRVANIPASATLTGWFLSTTSAPGSDMAAYGMPGCKRYLALGREILLGTASGQPTATLALTLPTDPSLVGFESYVQAYTLVPGINQAGAITTNGLWTKLGTR